MKPSLVKFGKWMLIVLFMGYYISITMFYHTHYFPWGTVTHSHPYMPTNSETSSHTHTQSQCLAISSLANLLLVVAVFAFFICKPDLVQKIYIRVRHYVSFFRYVFSPLRGPPIFICS
jgi:hypothetical protein